MKHNSGNRRTRPRGNKPRSSGGGGRNNFESNGPDGKVRGTAQQVLDKYLALARDAQSSGDRINAESFFQYAEHYYRVLNADGSGNSNQSRRDRQSSESTDAADETPDTQAASEDNDRSERNDRNDAEAAPQAVDPADLPQPDIASVIPPAIAIGGGDEAPSPKLRRRRTRAKSDESPDEPETAQAS